MNRKITEFDLANSRAVAMPPDIALDRVDKLFCLRERGLSFSFETVDLSSVKPVCKFVFSGRIFRCSKLINQYEASRISLYEPISLEFPDGSVQFVPPPVIECRPEGLIVCDGMHRVYTSLQKKLKSLKVLVLHNLEIPLPGIPMEWSDVSLQETQLPVEENFKAYSPEYLTGYTFKAKCVNNVITG